MISAVTHILPLAQIRRRRVLPVAGTVLVRAGQPISANDVIAEANLHPEHIALDVARGLGVSRGKAGSFIRRKVGDDVSADGIIASRSGMAARVVRTPVPGRVMAISGGQVLLEVRNEPYQLLAGLSGTVAEVIADFGAVIETTGGWIQGVWGNGHIGVGGLQVLAEDPGHELTSDQVNPSQRGAIMLAGYCGERLALESAAQNSWRGLILSSMATQLVPVAASMPYPIVILEGFGRIAMNATAHRLIASNAEREVVMNAMAFDRLTGKRPEIIIPLEGSASPQIPVDLLRLEPGLTVRLLKAPKPGAVGVISAMIPGLARFESGLRTPGAEIELTDGEKLAVPLANIEVIG